MLFRQFFDFESSTYTYLLGCEETGQAVLVDPVMADDGTRRTYRMRKFNRSNHGTCANQRPIVDEGQRVEAGQVLADGPCTENGEMALNQRCHQQLGTIIKHGNILLVSVHGGQPSAPPPRPPARGFRHRRV